jgi:hypothetical protein
MYYACEGEKSYEYRELSDNLKGRDYLGGLGVDGDNIKMCLKY